MLKIHDVILGANILNYTGNNVTQFFNILTDTKVNPSRNAEVFTDNPNF